MYNVVNGAFALSEFALGIALTVFVGATVLLVILLICLAASKSFRAVFFRERAEKAEKSEKADKKKAKKAKEPDPLDDLEEIPVPPPQQPTARTKTATPDKQQQAKEELEFLEMVETIPLEAMTLPPDRPRAHRIPLRKSSEGSEGGTYSPRMITITRARGGNTKPAENEVPPTTPTPTARRGIKRD